MTLYINLFAGGQLQLTQEQKDKMYPILGKLFFQL
jgi:hypothetical protein